MQDTKKANLQLLALLEPMTPLILAQIFTSSPITVEGRLQDIWMQVWFNWHILNICTSVVL